MTEMKARLVDKDGNPLGTAANPLKISGDVGGGVPDGGTTGQVLQKKTDADQDTEWQYESVRINWVLPTVYESEAAIQAYLNANYDEGENILGWAQATRVNKSSVGT